jgi:hypothetical protein
LGLEDSKRAPGVSRDFVLQGRVRAPSEYRDKTIKVTLSPFGPKVRFRPDGRDAIGALKTTPGDGPFDLEAQLMMPEDAIATTALGLSSAWKLLQIQSGRELGDVNIFAFSFHAYVPPLLESWANAE